MSINNVEIQDNSGNVYYPHTDASVVKFGDTNVGSALSDKANIASPNFTGTPTINSKGIVTSISPTEIAITPLNGFSIAGGSKATYYKTQENEVTINCFLMKSAGQQSAVALFSLPTGYRPSSLIRAMGIGEDTYENIPITIGSDGTVATGKNTNVSFTRLFFEASFVAV